MRMIHRSDDVIRDLSSYTGSKDWYRSRNKMCVLDLSRQGDPRMIDFQGEAYDALFDRANAGEWTASRDGLVHVLGEAHRASIEALMVRVRDGREQDLQTQGPYAPILAEQNRAFGFCGAPGDLTFDVFILNEDGTLSLFGISVSPKVFNYEGSFVYQDGKLVPEDGEANPTGEHVMAYLKGMGPKGLKKWLENKLKESIDEEAWENMDRRVGMPIIVSTIHKLTASGGGYRQEAISDINPRMAPNLKVYDSPRAKQHFILQDASFDPISKDWPRSRQMISIIVNEGGRKRFVDVMSPEFDGMFSGDIADTPNATSSALVSFLGQQHAESILRVMTRLKKGQESDLQLQSIGGDIVQAVKEGVSLDCDSPGSGYYYVFEVDEDSGFRIHTLFLIPRLLRREGYYMVVDDYGILGSLSGYVRDISSEQIRKYLESMGPRDCINWLERTHAVGFRPEEWEDFRAFNTGRFPMLVSAVSQMTYKEGAVSHTVMAEVNSEVFKRGFQALVVAPKEQKDVFSKAVSEVGCQVVESARNLSWASIFGDSGVSSGEESDGLDGPAVDDPFIEVDSDGHEKPDVIAEDVDGVLLEYPAVEIQEDKPGLFSGWF